MSEKLENILTGVGNLLWTFRASEGLSQREAAAKVGSTQARLSDMEQGRRDIRLSNLVRWAELYGYDVEINFVPIEDSQETPSL